MKLSNRIYYGLFFLFMSVGFNNAHSKASLTQTEITIVEHKLQELVDNFLDENNTQSLHFFAENLASLIEKNSRYFVQFFSVRSSEIIERTLKNIVIALRTIKNSSSSLFVKQKLNTEYKKAEPTLDTEKLLAIFFKHHASNPNVTHLTKMLELRIKLNTQSNTKRNRKR